MPTAPKCCKKHYEIKIFFSHDQNMTKNVPHARRANHDQELTKTAKKHKQKHFQSMPTAQKCCKKKSRNNIFVWSDEKSQKTSKKVTLSRSPHSSKILKKNNTEWICSFWDSKKHSRIECKPDAHRDINSTTKTENCLKQIPFRDVPTAPKCCKKQYEINIFALGASKKHWRIKYKPHAHQDIKFTRKK